MAITPEQRDKHAMCGAKKKNGEKCRAYAGQGTEHPGIGTCKFHLGNAPNNRTHAIMRRAKQKAESIGFGKQIHIQPADALMEMLWLAYGQVAWLHEEINKHKDLNTFEARVLVQSHKDERDRTARIAKAALDAGVAERQVRIAELYGKAIAKLIQGILGELDLTPGQFELVAPAVRKHLAITQSDRPELAAVS